MNRISPTELYEFLKSKNINHLYFACSVKTACSIINCGNLLSKHKLSLNKLPATGIDSAETDKAVGLWNKIIFHICDLHGYFARQNKFGPVCFVLNIEFLLDVHENDLWVSKKNPLHWKKGTKKSDLYYFSVNDFAENFENLIKNKKAHKNLILIRDKKTEVNLKKHLVEIILDKPGERHLLFMKSKKALLYALENANFQNVSFKIRNCKNFCFCSTNYAEMSEAEIKELFSP